MARLPRMPEAPKRRPPLLLRLAIAVALAAVIAVPLCFFWLKATLLPSSDGKTDQQIVSAFADDQHTGVLALVERHGQPASYAAGQANVAKGSPMTTDAPFPIGSTTKLFVAVAVLQLVEEGRLELNTGLGALYPTGDVRKLGQFQGRNTFDEVTVEMLLNNTSGFTDYMTTFANDQAAVAGLNGSTTAYTTADLIALAAAKGDAQFAPGTRFGYSNTNYILLGDIIGKVSGQDWRDYVQARVLDRAGLSHTWFGTRLTPEQAALLPQGYYAGSPASMPYSIAGSSGELVSTLADLNAFLHAWSSGRLFRNPDTFNRQLTTGTHAMDWYTPYLTYSLGVMGVDGAVGHPGQTIGFQCFAGLDPATGNTYVVAANNADARALALFSRLRSGAG